MKKFLFVLLISCMMCGYVSAQNVNVVEDELQDILNQKGDAMIDVTIVFKSQMDAAKLKSKAERNGDKYLQREIVVSELKDFSARQQKDVMSILQAEERSGNVANISSLWIVNAISCSASRDVIYQLASHTDVAALSYNKQVKLIDDAQLIKMGSQNLSDKTRGYAEHIVTVNADDVWNQNYTGKNVVVAVLDSGSNIEHKDLRDHLWEGEVDGEIVNGWNVSGNNNNSEIIDNYGHGTYCAGIVCGDGTSGTTTGIAPDARLMTVKILEAGLGSVADMIEGVQFAVDNNADILNISSGFRNDELSVEQKELIRETFYAVLTSGVIVCAAAGNDGNSNGAPYNVDYPAACPSPWNNPDQTLEGGLSSVVCVGAYDLEASAQGPSTWEDTKYGDYKYNNGESMGLIRPDIAAPGVSLYTLNHKNNDAYWSIETTGTSFSTPCVAGVMALMLEKNPSLTPADLCRIVETTAANKPEHKNNVIGAGHIDALAAVAETELNEPKPYIQLSSFSPETLVKGNNQQINVTVINKGHGASSSDAQYTISLNNDSYATLAGGNTIALGTINSLATKETSFDINVSPETPNGHVIYVTLMMKDGDLSWENNFAVKVEVLPNVVFKSCTPSIIRPEDGNVDINVTMQNTGKVPMLNDTEIILSADNKSLNYIEIVDDNATIAPLDVDATATATFTIKAKEDAKDGYLLDLFLEVFSESNTETSVVYKFENDLEGWTTFDADDDILFNNIWWHSSEAKTHGKTAKDSYSGEGHLMSETVYHSSIDFSGPIDDYLVSPNMIEITENSEVSFYARAHEKAYCQEHFGFAVATNSNNTVSDFTTIQEWHITQQQGTTWNKYTVDLSEYAGEKIYVAIRHFFTEEEWNDTEMADYGHGVDALNIDDIVFSNVIIDYHDMPTYSNIDANYFNIVISNPVEIDLDAPTNLVTSNITTESIALSWNEVDKAQSYNVYRDGEMIANVAAATYADNNLTHNTEYCYTVAGVHNSNVHEQCEPVCATTLQKDYSVAIQSFTPGFIYAEDNTINLSITFVNDGRYEHESKCYYKVTSIDSYVTINTGQQTNATLAAGATTTKAFSISINENVPHNHEIIFNAEVDYMFGPQQGAYGGEQQFWDIPFSIIIKNDPNAPKNLAVSLKSENSVTLTWNAVANAIRYNVYRNGEFVGNTTAATYFDGGLNAETEYTYQVTSVTEDGESEESKKVVVTTNVASEGIVLQSFAMGTAIGENISLTATLINKGSEATPSETTATLTCTDPFVTIVDGTADLGSMAAGTTATANFTIKLDENIPSNYNLNFDVTAEYESNGSYYQDYEYTFDTDFDGWGNYSWQQNGYKWEWSNGLLKSYSWKNKAITPDAFLVSPIAVNVDGNTKLSFDVDPTGINYYEEYYSINVSEYAPESWGYENGQFTQIYGEKLTTSDKQTKTIYLNDYPSAAGKTVYVIIRHHNCTNQDAITIDNIIIENALMAGSSTISNISSFSVIANQSLNTFAGTGLWSEASLWSKGIVPTASDDVIIDGSATIENGNITVNSLTINNEKSLTVEGGVLTVSTVLLNADAEAFIISDGAQVIQYNDNVAATFNMNIVNWNDANNWQFIASPVKNVKITDFIPAADGYDLFKYDGSKDGAEWVNYQGHVSEFEKTFQQGRGYLASYETETAATFAGVLNSAGLFTFEGLSYDSESHYSNFHLLGNPFTFDMVWNNVAAENIYENGFATINVSGSYTYHSGNDVIPAGDGFFVLTRGENPSLSYGTSKNTRSVNSNSINLIASSKMGDDNVIIDFTGEETEGFNKLDNFNENIAEIYVGNRYAIMSYDENTTEVEVAFHAKEMGNYTIAAVPTGKFSSIVLTDKFNGIETNLLIEDYHFTATSGDNVNRFIVKLAVRDQQSAISNFVYQSGEELVIEAGGTVQIVDVMGRMVYNNDVTSDNNRIDVSDFNKGTYVVRVINESEVKVEKVVIY